MNITKIENRNRWEVSTDTEHILHLKGSEDWTPIRRVCVYSEEAAEQYEEVAVGDVPKYTKAEYDAKVAELIRARYSEDEELAIQRKALAIQLTPATLSDDDGEAGNKAQAILTEFAEYNAFAEQCKADAKNPELYKPDAVPDEGEEGGDDEAS